MEHQAALQISMNKGMSKKCCLKIFKVNIRIKSISTNCIANHISPKHDILNTLNTLNILTEQKSVRLECDKLLHYFRSQCFLA